MDVELLLPTVVVPPGGTIRTVIRVANTSERIDEYTADVYGVDPEWVTTEPPVEQGLPLFPGEVGELTVLVRLPDGFPAGERRLSLRVQSANDPADLALLDLSVTVQAQPRVTMSVQPSTVTGGSVARYTLLVANQGNVVARLQPRGEDPEDRSELRFFVDQPDQPPTSPIVEVEPGRQEAVDVRVQSQRPWFGSPKPKLLTFTAGPDIPPVVATFVQRPRISRLLVSLLGLVAVALVFAAVVNGVVDKLVKQTEVKDALIDNALASGVPPSATASADLLGIEGELVATTTGEGIAGVQVDLFREDNPTVVVATAATSTTGRYVFVGLEGKPVEYLLRFSGAGFAPQWWPGVDNVADALSQPAVRVATPDAATSGAGRVLRQVPPGPPVALVGEPGAVRGRVNTSDPSGAVVQLVRPGAIAPGETALVAETPVSVDGSFELLGIPSPAEYRLVVRKPGSAVQQLDLRLDAGQEIELDIPLREADGRIRGTVVAAGQPVGGAVVTASDGVTQISTVSLTEADGPRGAFELRGLTAPGTYTITTSRPGFSAETRSVTVPAPAPADTSGTSAPAIVEGVRVELLPATGSIGGRVAAVGFGPVGGVTVSVASGELEVRTLTLSQGDVGSFLVEALPAPGSYTVTLSAPGLVSQTLQVDLDPASGRTDVRTVSASLISSTVVVRGTVTDADGAPVAGAEVELTDGTDTWKLVSADEPRGAFELSRLPPGAYILSASVTGANPAVVLVNLRAGEVWDRPVRLERQASLSGQVLRATGLPYEGAEVRLYLATQFPPPPGAPAIATVKAGPAGDFRFLDVEAPQTFVVAAYRGPGDAAAFAVEVVSSQPSVDVPVPPLKEIP